MAGKIRNIVLSSRPGLFAYVSSLLFYVASNFRARFSRKFTVGRNISCVNGGRIGLHHRTDILLKNSKIIIDGGDLLIGITYGYFDGGGIHSGMDACRVHLSNGTLYTFGNVSIYPGATVLIDGGKISIGDGTRINTRTQLISKQEIKIGRNCMIAQNVLIRDNDGHQLLADGIFQNKTQPVAVGDNVWIGQNATILKGVTVGSGAIIAAGSVVTNNVPEKAVVAGVPAKVVKENIEWKA